jgi:hypothetical protein
MMRKFTSGLFLAFLFLIFSAAGMAQKKIAHNKIPEQQNTATASSAAIKKIDIQLLSGLQQSKQVNNDMGKAASTTASYVTVEIRGIVTATLLKLITNTGGKVFSSSVENNSIVAKIPFPQLEKIAASDDVKFIQQGEVIFNTIKTPSASNKVLLKEKPVKSNSVQQ